MNIAPLQLGNEGTEIHQGRLEIRKKEVGKEKGTEVKSAFVPQLRD
jgi:hypothetical protein